MYCLLLKPLRGLNVSMIRQKLARYWWYFRRGHSTYFVYLLTFANFIVIQYRLLIEHVSFLEYLFPTLTSFAITFLIIYPIIAILVGYLDYKKFAVPVEVTLIAKANPLLKDLCKAIILHAQGKNQEVEQVLKKWVSS